MRVDKNVKEYEEIVGAFEKVGTIFLQNHIGTSSTFVQTIYLLDPQEAQA